MSEYDEKLQEETNRILDEQDWDGLYNALEDSKRLEKAQVERVQIVPDDPQLTAHLNQLEADSKRLDKLLGEGCYVLVRLQGMVGPMHTREDIDKLLEEPHE